MKKKLLIFANPFKPMTGIGTKRVWKFIKYLPKYGWETIVVAPKVKGSQQFDEQQSIKIIRVPLVGPSLLYDIARKLFPRNTRTVNGSSSPKKVTPMQKASRRKLINDWLFVPDEYFLWGLYASKMGQNQTKASNIDACFATGPSFSTLIAGALYSKRTGKKLFVDFRDPWIGNEFIKYKTRIHKKLNQRLEKFVINQAYRVFVVSPFIKEMYVKRYPQHQHKFKVITNGYDIDDLPVQEKKHSVSDPSKTIITHAGTFYGEKNPGTFLKALKLLREENSDLNILVRFVGGLDSSYIDFIKENRLQDWVEYVGYVSYEESMAYQFESDILLLIPGPGKGTITGKFYEYLSMKKPILCVGEKGSNLEMLLEHTDSGIITDVKSPEEIKNALLMLIQKRISFTFSNVEDFEYKALTQHLSQSLENAFSPGKNTEF